MWLSLSAYCDAGSSALLLGPARSFHEKRSSMCGCLVAQLSWQAEQRPCQFAEEAITDNKQPAHKYRQRRIVWAWEDET